MDDDRLISRLRGIDASADPPPQFVEELHELLAGRLGFPAVDAAGPSTSGPVSGERSAREPFAGSGRRSGVARRIVLLVAAAMLLAALAANAATIGSLVDRLIHPPAMLDEIRRTGQVRFGVTEASPQVRSPAGGLDGFDFDVADALASRIGARAEITVTSPAEILGAAGDKWQVAMPGLGIDPAAADAVLLTRPYYRWPVYLVGRAGQGAAVALDGSTICVVLGSAGEAWLGGAASGPAIEVRSPAPRAIADPEPDEAACRARLAAGAADAMVTSTTLPADLASSGTLRLLADGPVAVEPRALAVPSRMAGSGALRDALDEAIVALEADGTLADLARARFGTDSVVSPPAAP